MRQKSEWVHRTIPPCGMARDLFKTGGGGLGDPILGFQISFGADGRKQYNNNYNSNNNYIHRIIMIYNNITENNNNNRKNHCGKK